MDKELSIKFFIDLTDILREYIQPKSEIVAVEIKNIIKSVCRSHGYSWHEGKITGLKGIPDPEA
jgi:hypothetical protein